MKYKNKNKRVYDFKKGERFQLDDIYAIQGLAGGDWWERTGDDLASPSDMDMSDDLICTRNIKITIIVESD